MKWTGKSGGGSVSVIARELATVAISQLLTNGARCRVEERNPTYVLIRHREGTHDREARYRNLPALTLSGEGVGDLCAP